VAIAFFSKVASSTSPTSHHVVEMTRESIVRKLDFIKTSKNPLLKEHVNQIVQYLLQQNTIQGKANAFRVALNPITDTLQTSSELFMKLPAS